MTSRQLQRLGVGAWRWERSDRVLPPLTSRVLRCFARTWRWTWGVALAGAALTGVLLEGWTSPLVAALVAASATVALLLALERIELSTSPQLSTGAKTGTAFAGLRVAALAACVSAAAGTLGGLVLPLGVVAAATSPWAARLLCTEVAATRSHLRLRPRAAAARRPAPTTPAVEVTATTLRSAVASLRDDELCRAWRSSFTCLAVAPSRDARVELVHLRQAYLDELERRHPTGFRAWLEAGARAAGDPSRHLPSPRSPHKD